MIDLYLNDVAASTLGVVLKKPPDTVSAAERGEWIEVAGVDGETWRSDHALASGDLDVELYVWETANEEQVISWLRGATRLRWGQNAWEYRVVTSDLRIEMKPWDAFPELGWEVRAQFKVSPYRYVWPHPADIELETNPATVTNPGTAWAAPEIAITGSGALTLMIGRYTVAIEEIGDGLILDCAEKRAYNLTRTALATAGVTLTETATGRWPRLNPGGNVIMWTGNAEIVITPNWRNR